MMSDDNSLAIDANPNIHSLEILKYPRTPHIEGSRLQIGDEGYDHVLLASLVDQYAVFEEKLDGANCAISFSPSGEVRLQSRGHYLFGGGRERQFAPFKQWCTAQEDRLLALLEDRYVMYGEWMYAKHSVSYDQLPHYFCEFDIFDKQDQVFLSTARRQAFLSNSPVISVPVLHDGLMPKKAKALSAMLRHSLAKSYDWRKSFESSVQRQGLDLDLCWKQTDKSDLSEGLYIKVENEHQVLGRFKWVRPDFVQTIVESGSHHSTRPIIPNGLATGVDLYAAVPLIGWPTTKEAL
jgi:hypothetical protein